MGSEIFYLGSVPGHREWSWIKIKDREDGMVCAYGWHAECLFQYNELSCPALQKAEEVLDVIRGDEIVMDGFYEDYDDD